jgi:hypothetical protein
METGYIHRSKRKTRRIADAMASADALLPEDIKGLDIFCFTAGQWSLMEMLCALLNRMGSAHLTASVWTAADADMRDAYDLIGIGKLKSLKLYVDRSFLARQPEYAKLATELFGSDSIYITRTHCKIAVLENDDYCFVCRGSMNLNHSPRWEQLEITEDREFGDWVKKLLKSSEIGTTGVDCDADTIQARLYAPF